jgi:hypothetical protein
MLSSWMIPLASLALWTSTTLLWLLVATVCLICAFIEPALGQAPTLSKDVQKYLNVLI